MEYGYHTAIDVDDRGRQIGGRALCSDGAVRAIASITPYISDDPYIKSRATVRVCGKAVSGFITTDESLHGMGEYEPKVVKFVANGYGKNKDMLPPGPYRIQHLSGTFVDALTGTGRALCSDGKLRNVFRYTEDKLEPYCPLRGSVRVGNTTVMGYIELEDGIYKFVRFEFTTNAELLPPGTFGGERTF